MKHIGCIHMDPSSPTAEHQPCGKSIAHQDYHDESDRLADRVENQVLELQHGLHQPPW